MPRGEGYSGPQNPRASPESTRAWERLFPTPPSLSDDHRSQYAAAERWYILGAAALWAVVMLPMLTRAPRVFGDDSWSQAMAAYTIAFEGHPRNPGHVLLGGVDEYLLEPRLFGSVVGAAFYRAMGFSLTAGRLAAMSFSGLFLIAVYLMMRRLFGVRAGTGVTLLTIVAPWVFITGRTYRPEIFLAALLWWSAVLFFNGLDRRSRWRVFSGGACIGLACWTHPNAVAYTAAALIGIGAVAGSRVPWRECIPPALTGVLVGAAPYVLYVAYVQQISDVRLLDQVGWRAAAYTRPVTNMLLVEQQRWSEFLRLPERIPLALLYLGALIHALLRGGRPERLILVFVLASSPMFALINHLPTGRYLVVLVPALIALVWRALPTDAADAQNGEAGGGPRIMRTWLRNGVTLGVLLVYASMTIAPTLLVYWGHRRADYQSWMMHVAQNIPPDATVMAHTAYWTGLCDRRFVSSVIPPEWSVADAVAHVIRYQPEYVIQSSHSHAGVGGVSPRPHDLRATVFGQACEDVAAQIPSEVLTELYDRDFGAARVWRFRWPVQSRNWVRVPSR